MTEKLHVITMCSNPNLWESRYRLARECIPTWQQDDVEITLVEVAHGSRPFVLDDLPVRHIGLRQTTTTWVKEGAWNAAVHHLPHDAHKLCFLDADIIFRDPTWSAKVRNALDLAPIVHPWSHCYDLGPGGSHGAVHTSFGYCYNHNLPLAASGQYGVYSHPGYGVAMTRTYFDAVGGLFDLAAMGAGDYTAMLGVVGKTEMGFAREVGDGYRRAVREWSHRAEHHANGKLGYTTSVIEHKFHGKKTDRKYISRWSLFEKHSFDPHYDLKRNSSGLYEWAGNKPRLEFDWNRYLLERAEDSTSGY